MRETPALALSGGDVARHAWRLTWVRIVAIYVASRVVTTVLVLATVALARPGSRIGQHASVFSALAAWDGQWYRLVAFAGYPSHLPAHVDGIPQTSAWAFLPAYPYLVKLLVLGNERLWTPGAEIVSAAFGLGAALLLAALLRPHVGRRGALVGVLVFSFGPMSFLLQAAYAEAMGLFLLLAVLVLVERRRYLVAVVPTLVLAFTRPGSQAVALLILLVVLRRIWSARGDGAVPRRDLAGAAVLFVVSFVSGFAWDWTAALVTGQPDAYLNTELAWRTSWMGVSSFAPGVPWLWGADFWFGPAGPVVLATVVAGFTALLLTRWVRQLGDVSRFWLLSWALYLIAVFFPQSSTFRLLMPMAPAAGAFASIRGRTVLTLLLAGSVGLQALWLYATLGAPQTFWNVL
jgi:hypothetical protein